METIAFVEELGRNGDVVRRHVIEKLPARIGRGYESDVIVDDPHVASNHLEIRLGADGELEVVDLGSLNGTHRASDATRIRSSRIESDDVLRIGQTQLRFRLPGHVVPSELPLPQRSWKRHPLVFVGSVGLLMCFTAWDQYVKTFNTNTSNVFSLPITIFLLLLVWASVWSLVCRTLHGNSNFIAHGIVAFFGFSVILFVETLTEYINFSFGLRGLDLVWGFCISAVFASMLYRHLRLTVRFSPRKLTALAVFLTAILCGGIVGMQAVGNADKPGLQSFDNAIKPSSFLFSQGVTPDKFFDNAKQLKLQTDKDAGFMAR